MPFYFLQAFGLLPWLALVVLLVRLRRQGGPGLPLVIRQWRAGNEVDAQGRFVHICGRQQGILSWVLSALAVEEDTSVAVLEGRVEFEQRSLSGRTQRMIPFSSISSTEYGYHRPWKSAVAVFVVVGWTVYSVWVGGVRGSGEAGVLVGLFLGAIAAGLYFLLNRKLRLGFREHSGQFSGIQFKRSVIENQEIAEAQAGYVCLLVQTLIENDRARRGG